MDPWTTPLIVVRGGSQTAAERRSISRDRERGLLVRVRQGVYVGADDWNAGAHPERALARHVVRARALDAVAPWRPLFSHWTAAVLRQLPIMDAPLDRVHVTTVDARQRGLDGVLTHAFTVSPDDVRELGGLLVTSIGRTVVDVAGGSPFLGGVVTADAALHRGVPRELLEAVADLAGPRRASARIADVVAIAHPGAESAAESASYVSMFRLGFEPPELQHEVWDEQGLAGIADSYDRRSRIGAEVDGLGKYLDPRMAVDGTGMALVQEKRREDRMRAGLRGLVRYGYWDAKDPSRLRPVLAKVGLRPPEHRPTLADWAAEARAARPRAHR